MVEHSHTHSHIHTTTTSYFLLFVMGHFRDFLDYVVGRRRQSAREVSCGRPQTNGRGVSVSPNRQTPHMLHRDMPHCVKTMKISTPVDSTNALLYVHTQTPSPNNHPNTHHHHHPRQDVFNRPICSAPDAYIDVIDRKRATQNRCVNTSHTRNTHAPHSHPPHTYPPHPQSICIDGKEKACAQPCLIQLPGFCSIGSLLHPSCTKVT